jgi:hypothetical protein
MRTETVGEAVAALVCCAVATALMLALGILI